jgi:glucose/arabinose dehydrogenase
MSILQFVLATSISMFMSRIKPISAIAIAAGSLLLLVADPSLLAAQVINAAVASDFTLTEILAGGPGAQLPFATSIDAQIGQMTFGPDGRLYVATLDGSKTADSDEGIVRFDYSPTGILTNKTKVNATPSTSVAFHQDPTLGAVMYITDAVDIFGAGATVNNGVLRRMTDTNGDGQWGGAGDVNQQIVNNVPVEREHRMNQLQILGNSLYMGIGTLTTDGHNEAAYTGTVSWIEDLTTLSGDTTTTNIAGFNEAFVTAGVPSNSITPMTSTDPSKLRVHSIGLRNPFGIGLDGDGNLWASMNNDQGIPGIGTPSDLFFKAQQFANYGFKHEYTGEFDAGAGTNRGDGTPYTDNPAVVAAGFSAAKNVTSTTAEGVVVGYNPAAPNGSLGPSAAVGGVDFATANGFNLRWHKDAFIGRWTFQDVVAVDLDTGETVQIASGFNRVLEVVADPFGNLLVAEAPLGDFDRARIYRIAPNNPYTGAHLLDWNENLSGNWSGRLNWGGDFDGDGTIDPPLAVNPNDRLVPHQWGTERYDVSISRQVAGLVVTLDQNAHVERVTLGNAVFYLGDNDLRVAEGMTLTLDDRLVMEYGGILSGLGTVAGLVENHHGAIRPTTSTSGGLHIDGNLTHDNLASTLVIDIDGTASFGRLLVSGVADLDGTLAVQLQGGFTPSLGDRFEVLTFAGRMGDFTGYLGLDVGGHLSLRRSFTATSLILTARPAIDGDINLDGTVNIFDINSVSANWGTTGPAGDANGDGIVDIFDINLISSNWGASGGASAVPEPSGVGLALTAVLGCLVIAPWRRRAPARLAAFDGEATSTAVNAVLGFEAVRIP